MKNIILGCLQLFAAGLLTLQPAQAQQVVPNGGFETWVTRSGGDAPDQWLTTDDLLRPFLPGLPTTNTVAKSTSSRSGNFAAQLTSRTTTVRSEVPGVVLLGTRVGDVSAVDSLVELGGLPYTSRPARLQFYYKFAGNVASPDDRPVVSLLLTRTLGGARQVVARAKAYLPATATNYTFVDLPLTYRAGLAPDSLHLAFGSADFEANTFTAGNSLSVDDVVLTGTVTATRDAQLQTAVNAYPNPCASGLFNLASAQEPALLASPLTVTDAVGRVVLQEPAGRAFGAVRPVDLQRQPPGVYSLRLDTPRGPVVHQLRIR